MDNPNADFARLALLLQRILDADVLYDRDEETLLTQTEAARHSLEEGDVEAACRHIQQIALFTEALVQSEVLDRTEGRAVIETAHRILIENAR